jgi:hypothetical protein
MQLAIFRSVSRTFYPEETIGDCFAFHPIPAQEQTRDDHLMGSVSESGLEPFVVVDVPHGSRVINGERGLQLIIPGRSSGIDAEAVYEMAMGRCCGLSIVGTSRSVVQKRYWVSSE